MAGWVGLSGLKGMDDGSWLLKVHRESFIIDCGFGDCSDVDNRMRKLALRSLFGGRCE
jgi:hypothetical protein